MPEKSFAFGSVVLAIVWGTFFYPPPPPPAPHSEPAATRVSALPPGAVNPAAPTVLR
ncbi:hypothetical protein SAMN05428948_1408 [Massilia sp. CF038]|nr:hypothetical protein SAMN05428948_1408 [Massilia sp. CF038]